MGKNNVRIEEFFDSSTMSVHLREGEKAAAKKGMPGKWKLEPASKEILNKEMIQAITEEIIETAENSDESFLEIQEENSTIAQIKNIRIVITRPPLSDAWEITAVRPIKKLKLSDYKLDDELSERLDKKAEGILVAGAPGEGKTTFVQALAQNFVNKQKVVKTIEAPRDLDVPKTVTRYALSHVKKSELRDILLLSRPDYTLFDEMRNTNDFKLFSDLRLSGVGMVGVVHANLPCDAVQRFIGRIELGVIPHVVDTVIFIKGGCVESVMKISMEVKVPFGMKTADLARPVVCIKDFKTNKVLFEIYSYGDQTVVVEAKEEGEKSLTNWILEEKIEEVLREYTKNPKAEMIKADKAKVYVMKKDVARIIGKDKSTIKKIEKKLGIKLEINGKNEKEVKKEKTKVNFDISFTEKNILLNLGESLTGKLVEVHNKDEFLLSAKVGKKGVIKVRSDSDIGKEVQKGIKNGKIKLVFA